jgi:hypothetical protein
MRQGGSLLRDRQFLTLCLLAGCCFLSAGCALTTGYSERRTTSSNERRCAPAEQTTELRQVSLGAVDRAQDDDPLVQAAKDHLPLSFSWRAIRTAEAINIRLLLSQIELIRPRLDDRDSFIRLLAVRQEALGRVMLALIAVSSTAAQVSCEIERTYQVADRLKNAEQARVRQQTLLAVILGAGAAVASGGISLAGTGTVAEGVASIAGGTIAGGLGISALYQESEQHFEHKDNMLRELWDNPTAPVYTPPAVWDFLNRPIKDEASSRTFREELINNWRQEGRLGPLGSEEEQRRIGLLFSDGGPYRSADLIVRGQMLDMLRASILLMNQELEILIRELMIQVAVEKKSEQPGPQS